MRQLGLAVAALIISATASFAEGPTSWGGGTLLRVNAAESTIDVQQGGHVQTYVIAKDADIRYKKDRLQIADLEKEIGRHLTVRYSADGSARTADRIKFQDTKGTANAKAAPATSAPATTPF